MEETRFWAIIATSQAGAGGDLEEQPGALHRELSQLSVEEVLEFQVKFDEHVQRAYTWDLWGAAFVVCGGCSDDGFMDFRGWLIAKGETVYREALKNPQSLVNHVNEQDEAWECMLEEFLYVAGQVWCEKTGQDLEEFPQRGSQLGEEPTGAPFDEDNLEARYPLLCERFF